jgi:hypothetical protein
MQVEGGTVNESRNKVWKIHPDAKCEMWATAWDDGFIVHDGNGNDLAGGVTREEAWDNAAKELAL